MVTVTIDVSEAKEMLGTMHTEGVRRFQAITEWMRESARKTIEALLRAELAVLLERDRDAGAGAEGPNWRNGYRTRSLSVAGLGRLVLRVPRDRQGRYRSSILPFRKRRTVELEQMAAEMFLAGLSTRDVSRVLERHFGDRFDSKEVSRMVAGTSGELDAWRQRDLGATTYRALFLDGTHFKIRRGKSVETIPVLVVVGMRSDDERLEVLALEIGEREHRSMWLQVFSELTRRGLDAEAVELGVMDGLSGLEGAFTSAFPNARTQRCQVHAKRNAIARVGKRDREEFRTSVDRVFYATSEAAARKAFVEMKRRWQKTHPSAVATIERDLDSLLRFYEWEERYWPSLRTTNPIERVHKEFKRRTKAMEIVGGEATTYRLLAYVAMTMNVGWKKYVLSAPKHFYTLKAA